MGIKGYVTSKGFLYGYIISWNRRIHDLLLGCPDLPNMTLWAFVMLLHINIAAILVPNSSLSIGPRWHAQYQLYEMRCYCNAINFLQSTPHILPLRARYGMSFMSAISDICYASVTGVLYAILWYTVYFITTLDCIDIYTKISRGTSDWFSGRWSTIMLRRSERGSCQS